VSGAQPRGRWDSPGPRQAAAGRRSGFNVSYALRIPARNHLQAARSLEFRSEILL